MGITILPSLDDVAREPQKLEGLDLVALAALVLRANAVAGSIAARLALTAANGATPAPASDGGDRLLTAKELAKHLGTKESWVMDRARAGRIPRRMVGRYVRFDLAEVKRALAETPPAA